MKEDLKKGLFKQEVLHRLESKCTQEEMPACNAICPIHIDMKAIIAHVVKGDFKSAYQLYSKTLPFPGIVAHTCNAPCKNVCKRAEIGSAINMIELEKSIYYHGYVERKKPLFLPKNQSKVAIIGGGLRGMTAAFDLARKGYQITLYDKEERLGGHLWEFDRETLPEDVLIKDIDDLLKYPIQLKLGESISCNTQKEAEGFLAECGAHGLYISCHSDLYQTSNSDTLQIDKTMIFTGSRERERVYPSSIDDVFDGRSAATSIDRVLKKVSIMAGREKEGGFATTLFTDTSQFMPSSEIPKGGTYYTRDEAMVEAARCIQCECMECVKGCAFMRHYKTYPKRFVREVYNNLSIPIGTHHANKPINTCNACGQCAAICPNGLNMADIYLVARSLMVESEKMPQSVHEFAMLDMEYSNGEDYFLSMNQSGFNRSKYAFFPSCQLGASEPELTQTIYEDLCKRLDGGVGILLACCSIIAKWSGEEKAFHENLEKIVKAWEELGKPLIITACPTCSKTLSEHTEMQVVGIWEVLKDDLLPEYRDKNSAVKVLAIHDACSSRYDTKTQEDIRFLACELGYEIEEVKYSKRITPCCGYGGLTPFADPALANEITESRITQTELPFLTYCVNCRDRFLKEGKEAYHILELLYGDQVQVLRTSPTWSARQEHRAEVKRELLEKHWGIKTMPKEQLNLYISDELEKILEDRMILKSNISDTISHAEESSEKFMDPKSQAYIASYKPKNVTFWVAYRKKDDGYEVLGAYSHRMTLEKGGW